MKKSNETTRRHAWDHFHIFACQCGYIATKYEDMNTHNASKRKSEAENVARIDQLLYDKARNELDVALPRHFPPSDKLKKLIAKPRVYISPTKKPSSKTSVFQRLIKTAEKLTEKLTTPTVTIPKQ